MSELLFTGMDIPKEIQGIADTVKSRVCAGMTDLERKAYDHGVGQTLNILRALLEFDEEPIVHIENIECPTEMTVKELKKIFLR